MAPRKVLVYGLGVSGAAAVRHLLAQGVDVIGVDDATTEPRRVATELGIEVVVAPTSAELGRLAHAVDEIVVSPGVPAHHPIFALETDARLIGEVELAWRDGAAAIVAITGTNGKTTVTTLVTDMLERSGIGAVAAGNIGVALVDAVHSDLDVVVVEVSSFQLALTDTFRPKVATWLNFSQDHLDWHPDLEHYRRAKARLWANAGPGDIAVANRADPVVEAEARHAESRGATVVTFGLDRGDFTVRAGSLVDPTGRAVVALADMPRRRPHDVANALAAMATATAAGASADAVGESLRSFGGLPHRVELVGEAGGVRFFDDSKATTPGSTLAALEGFDSAVLIAGGRNKGLDLSVLRVAAPRLTGVVAIGEAAAEVEAAFRGACTVVEAPSMGDAVRTAAQMAKRGDAVLLSPACASFDWYSGYAQRGEDFVREVRALEAAHDNAQGGDASSAPKRSGK